MDLIGKQLPSVSAADNGKVLSVENGRWKAVDAGDLNAPVIIEFVPRGPTSGSWTGATWDELVSAYYKGSAYLAYGNLVERITGHSVTSSDSHELDRLIVQVTTGNGTFIRAEISNLNIVYFQTFSLNS